MKLSGWGPRYPVLDCRLESLRRSEDLPGLLHRSETLIPRGNGRAYGDAALNPDLTLSMLAMDRMQAFDAATGMLTCEGRSHARRHSGHLRAAGLVPAGCTGNEVCHRWRYDRRGCTRQEPSPRRRLWRTCRVADAGDRRRRGPGVQPHAKAPNSSGPPSAAWG